MPQELTDGFPQLRDWLKGGSKWKRFDEIGTQLRSNVAFHYDVGGKLIAWALDDRAKRNQTGLVTVGSGAHSLRFGIADDVIDSIVCRKLWKIPREADLRAEADKIVNELSTLAVAFLDFAANLVLVKLAQ